MAITAHKFSKISGEHAPGIFYTFFCSSFCLKLILLKKTERISKFVFPSMKKFSVRPFPGLKIQRLCVYLTFNPVRNCIPHQNFLNPLLIVVAQVRELPQRSQLALLRMFFSMETWEAVEHILLIPNDTELSA